MDGERVDIKVTMKSGKVFNLVKVEGTLEEITGTLNKKNFIYFGPLILNCSEIESIEEV